MDAKQTKQTGDGLRCRVCTGQSARDGGSESEERSGVWIARKALWGGPQCQGTDKARRSRGGAPQGVAVAECWGWRLGLVGGGGSAGSVLRSQGTLGPAKLSRYRARGIRMSTFLCSLRPDPAAAGLLGSLSLNGGGLIVAVEEKQSSLTRCFVVMALGCWGAGVLGALGTWRRWGLWGLCGVRSAPTGHRMCEHDTETTNR